MDIGSIFETLLFLLVVCLVVPGTTFLLYFSRRFGEPVSRVDALGKPSANC